MKKKPEKKKYTSKSGKVAGLVLAAGFGTRMKPLSDDIPKPLLPVCGKPIVDIALDKLFGAGVRSFAVNTHYSHSKIGNHLFAGKYASQLKIFHEKKILGTGGVLTNGRPFLSKFDHFILHNGDILSDIDLKKLLAYHVRSGAIATLAVIEGPENRVLIDHDEIVDIVGKLCVPQRKSHKLLTYAGISVFSKNIFDFLPGKPEYCTLVDILINVIEKKLASVKAFNCEGCYWNDIGTFKKYFDAHEDIIKFHKLVFPGLKIKQNYSVTGGAAFPRNPQIEGFASIGAGCRIGKGSILQHCIVLDNTEILPGSVHRNEIVHGEKTYHQDTDTLKKLKILENCEFRRLQISSVAEHGSSRNFYRISNGKKRSILMVSSAEDTDFHRFIRNGRLFHRYGIGSPEIFNSIEEEYSVMMEDLGDNLVFGMIKSLKGRSEIENIYRKIIDWLFEFHMISERNRKHFEIVVDRAFDLSGLRWETEYFTENFLGNYLKVGISQTEKLRKSFDMLAEEAMKQPQMLIHRDFQSQNIIMNKGTVRIVDFQGARFGPICYDLMSLVYDPYVIMPPGMRDLLTDYYFAKFEASSIPSLSRIGREDFAKFAVVAGLQRLMQALGAYSFLSMKKGKTGFLEHIPAGVRNLRTLIDKSLRINSFPVDLSPLQEILGSSDIR